VRWNLSARRIILASLPSFCQKLSKLVEIWRSSDKNKFAQFFSETRCICWKIISAKVGHLSHYESQAAPSHLVSGISFRFHCFILITILLLPTRLGSQISYIASDHHLLSIHYCHRSSILHLFATGVWYRINMAARLVVDTHRQDHIMSVFATFRPVRIPGLRVWIRPAPFPSRGRRKRWPKPALVFRTHSVL